MNTVDDTILMVVEPWFSSEVGKDFLKWENGGGFILSYVGWRNKVNFSILSA